ncbi:MULTISPECIES: DUF4355 domain-containing protein [Anaerostipes]|uniref:DUF4355 domain-containing protein n=1 Tax=Anaerostipes TaxID=207244 RepID=UPI0009F905D9|nr:MULTISPECIES: DUF4355 domain-containing protein [Anaerostipes]
MEKYKLFLQLFTEGDDGGTGDGNGDGSGAEGGNNEPMSFDDFLGLEGNQAEFDRRLNKAVKTAVTNAEEKWKALTDDKLTEAEKLAKMTKEEKAEYRAKKAEKELADLKKMNARTELAKTARKMLADECINIPDELLSNLVTDDADGTNTAVKSFAKMYKEAVQAAVKEAIKGKPPKAGTGGGNTITKEQIMDIKDPIERQKMIRENINLFQ